MKPLFRCEKRTLKRKYLQIYCMKYIKILLTRFNRCDKLPM